MLSTAERKPLGQILLGKGLIKSEGLDRALLEQRRCGHRKLLGEILIELHECSQEQIVEALAQSYGVPFARINPRLADAKAVAALPAEFLSKYTVLPLFVVEGVMTVAVAEPADVFLAEEMERLSGRRVQVVAALAADIAATINCYRVADRTFTSDAGASGVSEVVPHPSSQDSGGPGDDASAARLVDDWLLQASREGASEVHVEPGPALMRVRYRIDGRLTEKLQPPMAMHGAVAARLKAMAALEVGEKRRPQEGSVRLSVGGKALELRVSTAPATNGEKIVVRVVDGERAAVNLEKLGFGYETLKRWRKLIALPHGMVLIAGPVGCGKDTTLYSVLRERAAADLNVCTVEDPVRYALPGVNQFQVDEKSGFTFAAAVRSVLRQGADILMIGELRDGELARLAAQAALGGHLVFGTLPTNDAPATITRLFNLGVEPYVLGASLSGILAQRLVRKLCPHCKESHEPTSSERREIEKHVSGVETVSRARGCPRCHNLGYAGRIGIYELLVPDDAMTQRITQGAALPELRDMARRAGMKPLLVDGMDKVKAGLTTLDEVYRATS